MDTAISHPLSKNQVTLVGFTFALLAAIGFSAKAIFVKLAYVYPVDAVTLLALRMAFSAPVFLGLALWFGLNKMSPRLTRNDWFAVVGLGLLGYYLSSLLDFLGLQYISAGLERLILFLYPTIVIILSALYFSHKIDKKTIIAILLSYAGIALVFLQNITLTQTGIVLGSLLVFASTISYAIYLIGAGQSIARIGGMRFMAYAMSVASIATLIQFAAIHPLSKLQLPLQVYELGMAMAVFSTILPAFFLAASIRKMGSGRTSMIGSIGPVTTIYMAHLFLGESITALQIAGSGLVLIGVLSISRH
ncbi:DMT family transporter [Sulfurirhabdus autotrophica]|uniref:Threonine/homoserine efflux transporter RhtA n=1 Tax=Sulfurirhabdus autotrophica TaxID=1706046 RepID=A0A4R3YET8_9PROT|nr:DMT family transporter [Sulfurirhabdus autotrophica]TCV88983.1 threonine/homoserine efflux transporter RhtA [Sulfurirhabdus autotrophica]